MQSKDYQKLLNCPFCGGEAILESNKLRYGTIYSAYCQKCGAEITGFSEHEAVAAWNRRAQPASEPLITCGECAKYQTPNCAAKHEQALMDFCSHGIRKPGGEQDA